MLRYSTSFHAVVSPDRPGEYNIRCTIVTHDGHEASTAFTVWEKRLTGMPEVHTTTDVYEWAIDWADEFYKAAAEIYADRKRMGESEINARPSSASTT